MMIQWWASLSFSMCDGWIAARWWRVGCSLWRWPELRVQHGKKTMSNCLAGNSLRLGEGVCSTGAEGKRDCPIMLNHHRDLCPIVVTLTDAVAAHGYTHAVLICMNTLGQAPRGHIWYITECAGAITEMTPIIRGRKKENWSPFPRQGYILVPALSMASHQRFITYSTLQPRCRLKVQITL